MGFKRLGFKREFVALQSTQIKLADGTNTTFNSNNQDIRYKKGGTTNEKAKMENGGDINYSDGGKLKLKKTYKQGGGEYTTIVNGKEVNIMKQYSRNTWVAQTWDGEIDIERDKLESIRYMLEQINNKRDDGNNTDKMENGGSIKEKWVYTIGGLGIL